MMYTCMYVYIHICMYVCMDGWMDGMVWYGLVWPGMDGMYVMVCNGM